MTSARDAFVEISAVLTGFSRVELLGTGVADAYLAQFTDALPEGMVYRFVEAFSEADFPPSGKIDALLTDSTWGPVARNLMTMWYCGTWTQLPASWRAEHGHGSADSDRVVSADTYLNALQWVAAGAHPVGARQQGFGAWATAPEPEPEDAPSSPSEREIAS